jgi:hypothetical protein
MYGVDHGNISPGVSDTVAFDPDWPRSRQLIAEVAQRQYDEKYQRRDHQNRPDERSKHERPPPATKRG